MKVDLNIKGDIEVLRLQPGDTIVVTLHDRVSPDQARQLADALKERFPGHETLVFQDAHLTVQRNEAA